MDSDDVIFVVASLCDCLKVCHHKTSDILRLALYQIINGNWQNYEQGIMSQPQLVLGRKDMEIISEKNKKQYGGEDSNISSSDC